MIRRFPLSDEETQPVWARAHLWQIPAARDVLALLAAGVAIYAVYYFWEIFGPLSIALLLAYIFHPLATWAHVRLGVPRVVSTLVILILSVGAVVAVSVWIGPRLVSELTDLLNRVPAYVENLASRLGFAGHELEEGAEELSSAGQGSTQEMVSAVWPGGVPAARSFRTALGATTYILIVAIVLPLYFFFLCWRFESIHRLEQFLPVNQREYWLRIINQMGGVFSNFFRARLIGAAILAVLFSIGLWLANVPYWFLLAMISALLNIIPYAAFIGWIAVLLVKYVDATATAGAVDWVAVLVWPTVVYLVVQAIDSWVLTPLIQGQSVNLSPVTVIVVLFLGGALAGLVGLILAIPIAACVKILLMELVAPRVRRWALAN